MKTTILKSLALSLVVIFSSFMNNVQAQEDTTKVMVPDTTMKSKDKDQQEKGDSKRRDEFIVYVGPNFNFMTVSEDQFDVSTKVGYHLGFNYKRGKFFYWQVGARFNNAVYGLADMTVSPDSSYNVAIRNIDIPVTGGINFLSAVNRIVALRLFVSAVPSIVLGVNDNDLGIIKDDLNTFVLYGQAGVGVNVAFFLLEAGFNYGFQDQLKNDMESRPGQVFINLGFRF